MTCIVGIECAGKVWLGSDAFIGTADSSEALDAPKIWTAHGVTVACAGNLGHADLAWRYAKLRRIRKREDPHEYLTRVWYKALLSRTHNDFSALVSVRGRLYGVEAGGVMRSHHGYMAEGGGAPFALGSLYSTAGLPPKQRIELALGAAVRHSPNVREPLHIVETR